MPSCQFLRAACFSVAVLCIGALSACDRKPSSPPTPSTSGSPGRSLGTVSGAPA